MAECPMSYPVPRIQLSDHDKMKIELHNLDCQINSLKVWVSLVQTFFFAINMTRNQAQMAVVRGYVKSMMRRKKLSLI